MANDTMTSRQQFEAAQARALRIRRLRSYRFYNHLISIAGGFAIIAVGIAIWWIGASWLANWLNSLFKGGLEVGYGIQLTLTLVQIALFMKLKNNRRYIVGIFFSMLFDVGTNVGGVLFFLFGLMFTHVMPVYDLAVFAAIAGLLSALIAYGPEKCVTAGTGWIIDGGFGLYLAIVGLKAEEEAAYERLARVPVNRR